MQFCLLPRLKKFKMTEAREESHKGRTKDDLPKPFCSCWENNKVCSCEEEINVVQWRWEVLTGKRVDLCEDQKQVNFHSLYSAGTGVAKGNVGIVHNNHYYWEIKMLTEPYGTDVMLGLGSESLNPTESAFDYRSFLGTNDDSYGMSYTGAIIHNSKVTGDCAGFCKGTIIGVRVDMLRGQLEFYLNRVPQGISFYNLRKHQILYPMICSTAARTSMRLIYASSWKESLLMSAAKILAASVPDNSFLHDMPPGLANILKKQFWMMLPREPNSNMTRISASIKRKHWRRRND